jgi:hypothetical protein
MDFRFWYGTGLQHQAYFSHHPRDSLDVTQDLGQRLIGLPMALDLPKEVILQVTVGLSRAT